MQKEYIASISPVPHDKPNAIEHCSESFRNSQRKQFFTHFKNCCHVVMATIFDSAGGIREHPWEIRLSIRMASDYPLLLMRNTSRSKRGLLVLLVDIPEHLAGPLQKQDATGDDILL